MYAVFARKTSLVLSVCHKPFRSKLQSCRTLEFPEEGYQRHRSYMLSYYEALVIVACVTTTLLAALNNEVWLPVLLRAAPAHSRAARAPTLAAPAREAPPRQDLWSQYLSRHYYPYPFLIITVATGNISYSQPC